MRSHINLSQSSDEIAKVVNVFYEQKSKMQDNNPKSFILIKDAYSNGVFE